MTLPPDWDQRNRCTRCNKGIGMIGATICHDCFGQTHTLCTSCCWGDRCDKPQHHYRPNCPECCGLGWFANEEPCPCATRRHHARSKAAEMTV